MCRLHATGVSDFHHATRKGGTTRERPRRERTHPDRATAEAPSSRRVPRARVGVTRRAPVSRRVSRRVAPRAERGFFSRNARRNRELASETTPVVETRRPDRSSHAPDDAWKRASATVASPVSDCWSLWAFVPPCGPFWKSSVTLTVCVAVVERFRVAGYPAHCCRANAAFSSNSSMLSGTVRKYVAPATGPNLLRRTEVHRRLHRDRFLPL